MRLDSYSVRCIYSNYDESWQIDSFRTMLSTISGVTRGEALSKFKDFIDYSFAKCIDSALPDCYTYKVYSGSKIIFYGKPDDKYVPICEFRSFRVYNPYE